MDVLTVMQNYILKLLEDAGPGMKVLLLDAATTQIVSCVYSQTEILKNEV